MRRCGACDAASGHHGAAVAGGKAVVILIEKLPKTVDEDEVRLLVDRYGDVASLRFIESSAAENNSCIVGLHETSGVVINVIAEKLNGLYWNGVQISAHCLLFG
jgi:hypothetical protein